VIAELLKNSYSIRANRCPLIIYKTNVFWYLMATNSKYHNSKLYYIHGYQSSPNGDKAILFKEQLDAIPIKYRSCEPEDLIIDDCLKQISSFIKKDKNISLIGSSLGGFLAAKTAINHLNVKNLILLNPAIIPPSTNLENHQTVPIRILNDMIDKRLFNKKLQTDISIIRGTNDDVVPNKWIFDFAIAQEANIKFLHDDHRLSDNFYNLPKIISNILK